MLFPMHQEINAIPIFTTAHIKMAFLHCGSASMRSVEISWGQPKLHALCIDLSITRANM
jgi:hypothetical protein